MSITASTRRRLGVAAITAIACAATLAPSPAAAAQPDSAGISTSGKVSDAAWAAGKAKHGNKASAQQALEAYWTPERMRAAAPAEELPEFKAAAAEHERTGKQKKDKADKGPAKEFSVPSVEGSRASWPPSTPTTPPGRSRPTRTARSSSPTRRARPRRARARSSTARAPTRSGPPGTACTPAGAATGTPTGSSSRATTTTSPTRARTARGPRGGSRPARPGRATRTSPRTWA